ncbi:MAG: ester cyclase [Thalassovita sp.]|nr:ester cyclase [Thalassovita sp.]
MSNRKLVETWFRRVWEEEDLSAIDEMMASPADTHGLGGLTMIGPDDFKQFAEALLGQIGNVSTKIEHFMEDGEWFHALIGITATGAQSGTPIGFTGQTTGKIVNGKFESNYNHFDFMTMYEQLGHLPQNTMDCCLSGRSLG